MWEWLLLLGASYKLSYVLTYLLTLWLCRSEVLWESLSRQYCNKLAESTACLSATHSRQVCICCKVRVHFVFSWWCMMSHECMLAIRVCYHLPPPHSWWCSIVVRTLVPTSELCLSCARLLVGWVTTLWLSRPLSVSQYGQLSHPSLRGQ